ncbi:tetratricopeptide repeat protein [Saccharopolyspora griseoalba]|uniref:Tetratricopeptide repeat protein n=1 Tax=Saccharopolyspora griseoalba TaxID=1431848 RepID=A0ABW2LBS5_9PSEU
MSTERQRLDALREHALRDIVELDRQVATGEIPETAAQRLRAEYEATAARALDALDSLDDSPDRHGRRRPGAPLARRAIYLTAGVVAVLAVAVVLPRFTAERPENGFITGNQVAQPARPQDVPRRDPSTVSNEEMEAVIARNPGVLGMRLALAERYLEQGALDRAAEHYGVGLKQQPDNPRVLAGAGRVLLAQDKPEEAARFSARALSTAPSSADALMLQAEILAPRDPRAARSIAQELTEREDLDPDVRRRADDLVRGGGLR